MIFFFSDSKIMEENLKNRLQYKEGSNLSTNHDSAITSICIFIKLLHVIVFELNTRKRNQTSDKYFFQNEILFLKKSPLKLRN